MNSSQPFFVDPDISLAKTLKKEFYLNGEIFSEAKEKIFSRCWHYIGDGHMAPETNDCYPLTLLKGYLDEPLILTNSKENGLNCLSNVCTHRGNLVVNEQCNTPHLRCRYHGRIFKHDGSFHSMPEFKEVQNFPSPADNLASMPLYRWGDLVFASLSHERPVSTFLRDMLQRMDWLPIDEFKLKPEQSQSFIVSANWALYCENYLEGFHIPFVHGGLNSVIDFGSYTTELFPYSNLQLGIARNAGHCFELPVSSPDYGKKIAAYYFFVFPNMMFNFYPWGLSLNLVEPVSLESTRVRFLNYVWKEELMNKGAGADLHTVEMEDEEIVEAVQHGIRSRFYQHGRYSVTREQGTHHFHRLICEFMNQ